MCATLQEIKENSPAGSVLVTDFYDPPPKETNMMNDLLKKSSENQQFGIQFGQKPREKVEQFIESESLNLGNVHCLGSNTPTGTFMVVAEILF